MAEECTSLEVPTIKDETPMECETSAPQSIKTDDSLSDKGALTLPPSGATSAAASTPVSDSECMVNPENVNEGSLTLPVSPSAPVSSSVSDSECAMSPGDTKVKEALTLSAISGAVAAAVSSSISDSECTMSPEDVLVKKEAMTLPVSGAASGAVSDSEVVTSPDKTVKVAAAESSVSQEPCTAAAVAPVSDTTAGDQEILSPDKVAELLSPEKKIGLFKGVKTAFKSTVKSVWKKLSPKKQDKVTLAASAQEAESIDTPAPETEKKPYKVVTYVSATRSASLVLNSVASDEVTLDTDLPTSVSEVFLPDQESIATSAHASRLPSFGESSSEPSQDSPEHNYKESTGHGDVSVNDKNVTESS